MTIHKCDRCGKDIEAKFAITAGRGWSSVELCEGCGKPVALFLRRLEKMKEGKSHPRALSS
jgi:hypothetical protein